MAVELNHCRVEKATPGHVQLVAARFVSAGEPVLVERPFLTVPVGDYVWGTYNWDFVARLLDERSLLQRLDKRKLSTTEFLLDAQDLAVEAELMRRHKLSRQRIRSLYFCVCTNNIGLLTPDQSRVEGYGLFDVMSRSNHSCCPTVRLQRWANGAMALVAAGDVRPGQPVCWSYFREEGFIEADYIARNTALVDSYRFACHCERCMREQPAELAGNRNLMGYFDRLIAQAAAELAKQPDALQQARDRTPMQMHRRAMGLL